jgi:cytochrome c oxidase subunit 1
MGAVFALFAGFYYWSPKVLGLSYKERLGQIHFWLLFIGANVIFMPMHFLGLNGMPRRIPDYPDAFAGWNYVASLGAVIVTIATFVFVYTLYDQLVNGQKEEQLNYGLVSPKVDEFEIGLRHIGIYISQRISSLTPRTIEWATTSPPLVHTFMSRPRQS